MMTNDELKVAVKKILSDVLPVLDERQKKLLLGSSASVIGKSGIAFVSKIAGVDPDYVAECVAELASKNRQTTEKKHSRKPGAGRKSLLDRYVDIPQLLLEIFDKNGGAGKNESDELIWTCLSFRGIADKLKEYGKDASQSSVSHLLDELGYHKREPKSYSTGEKTVTKEKQFSYINETVYDFKSNGDPIIYIDFVQEGLTTKTDVIQKHSTQKIKDQVLERLSALKEVEEDIPYLISGWLSLVNLGSQSDLKRLPLLSLVEWWYFVGKHSFPNARRILILYDPRYNGNINSELMQNLVIFDELANAENLEINVSYLPNATYRWKKIAHQFAVCTCDASNKTAHLRLESVVNLISNLSPIFANDKAGDDRLIINNINKRIENKKLGICDFDVPIDWVNGEEQNHTVRPQP